MPGGEACGATVQRSFHVQQRCVRTPTMKTLLAHLKSVLLALCMAGPLVAEATAMPMVLPAQSDTMVMAVGGDCYAIGQQVAEQNGGTLAKASSATRGGQAVCVIVVLVPGKDGQRPRRSEIIVPQN